MSRQDRHEGVSCDGCTKENFRGRRYKCLVCFDYDLCATCFDQGNATQRHLPEHPMQCILTKTDFDMYYGGDSTAPSDHYPQSLACPFCQRLGFSESTLRDHVTADHDGIHTQVVCPVCAATPNGEPNHMTEDLANHLTTDHLHRESSGQPEDQQHRAPRRTPAMTSRGGLSMRGSRRANNVMAGFGGSAFGRESVDPIAELLSQLGGIRRAGNAYSSTLSQIQQLQQAASRQGSRRAVVTTIDPPGATTNAAAAAITVGHANNAPSAAEHIVLTTSTPATCSYEDTSRYLMPTLFETKLTDEQRVSTERERTSRSLFVQDLFMSMLPTTALKPDSNVPNT